MSYSPPTAKGVSEGNAPYRPYGVHREVFYDRTPELVCAGPAGTGKSRAVLEFVHLACQKYPGTQAFFARKTRASITNSIQVIFEKRVLPRGSGLKLHSKDQQYKYSNGSFIAVFGLDDSTRAMSSEYDIGYVNEVTELEQGEYEDVNTRMRAQAMPYQQLLSDCNPSGPKHWMKQRVDDPTMVGKVRMLTSTHRDNPMVTSEYIARLETLTGARKKRLLYGIWAAAEGIVYEEYDPTRNQCFQFKAPMHWPRYWVVDFGYTHPFVWQQWVRSPDDVLFLEKEIYRTRTLVEDHARAIKEATAEDPPPMAVICDHDAEDRATLERHVGRGTVPARKFITPGIQTVKSRLKSGRMIFMRDALLAPWVDYALIDDKKPGRTTDEIDLYVWEDRGGKKLMEIPVDKDNHGMDCIRYLAAHIDGIDVVTSPQLDEEIARIFRQGSFSD